MKLTTALLVFTFGLMGFTRAEENQGIWKVESPDHAFLAAARRIPEAEHIWNEDLDGFKIVVFPFASQNILGKIYFTEELTSRLPNKIKWSDDSQYLVISTTSSGGHSPWHYKTFVFSIAQRKLAYVDDVVGSVVSGDFKMQAPHTAIFKVGDFERPVTQKIDLSELFTKKRPK